MEFRHFSPSEHLRPYIRCYYIFESDSALGFEDTVFPSSDMEMIFNLGEGEWAAAVDDQFLRTPPIELWGQITKPLAIRSKGRHTMLGIRFLTHSAAYFFDEEIGVFNDRVSDLSAVMGRPVKSLHTQLLATTNLDRRLALIETFLLKRLAGNEKKSFRIDKVAHILTSIRDDPSENSISDIASRHNITPRYLHKLVYQHTGLSPKLFYKINRFRLSLGLVSKKEQPFTSIAYDCGYFDQSHFIRDFKSFTGVTPSAYLGNEFPVNQALPQ
jgi:AraC-like DNA-binding protein